MTAPAHECVCTYGENKVRDAAEDMQVQAHEHEHDVVTAKKAARLPAAPRASSTPPTRAQRPDATTAVPAPEQTESPAVHAATEEHAQPQEDDTMTAKTAARQPRPSPSPPTRPRRPASERTPTAHGTHALDIPAAVEEDPAEADAALEHEHDASARSLAAWQTYYEQRQQLCFRHAQALEALLAEHPEHGPWLAQHGFDAPALVRALRWAPAEHLRAALGRTDAPRRARAAAQLRAEHRRNLRRMEENLARALPLFEEVQRAAEELVARGSRRTRKNLEIEELEVYAAGHPTAGGEDSSVYEENVGARAPVEPCSDTDTDCAVDT